MSKNPGRLTIVYPNGGIAISPLDDQPSAEQLHDIVGGHIELISSFDIFIGRTIVGATAIFEADPCVAFCNEHGKLQGLEPNPMATALWVAALARKKLEWDGDMLAGNVAIVTGDDILRKMREP